MTPLTPLEAKACWILADRGLDVPSPVTDNPTLLEQARSGIMKLMHLSHETESH